MAENLCAARRRAALKKHAVSRAARTEFHDHIDRAWLRWANKISVSTFKARQRLSLRRHALLDRFRVSTLERWLREWQPTALSAPVNEAP